MFIILVLELGSPTLDKTEMSVAGVQQLTEGCSVRGERDRKSMIEEEV
jgi:hypothetical protein